MKARMVKSPMKIPKQKTPKIPMPAQMPNPQAVMAQPPAFKHGGKVEKTGMAKVHKGEKVLTESQARKMPLDKLHKKLGGKDY